MSVKTWLDKIGDDIVTDFKKVEPAVEKDVEEVGTAAEPFITIFDPALLPLIQTTLSTIALAQAAGTAAAAGASTNTAKLTAVVSTITPIATTALANSGVSVNTTSVTNFVSALVAAVDAFAVIPVPASAISATPVVAAVPVVTATPEVTTAAIIDGGKAV